MNNLLKALFASESDPYAFLRTPKRVIYVCNSTKAILYDVGTHIQEKINTQGELFAVHPTSVHCNGSQEYLIHNIMFYPSRCYIYIDPACNGKEVYERFTNTLLRKELYLFDVGALKLNPHHRPPERMRRKNTESYEWFLPSPQHSPPPATSKNSKECKYCNSLVVTERFL